MSVRYTLRHLNASDCTAANIKLYELVATKDTGHILFRMGDGTITDITGASTEYATELIAVIDAKVVAYQKLVDTFNDNSAETLATAKTYADNAKTSEDNAFTYSGIAKESEEKALVSSTSAKAWAEGTGSPDSEADADSPTAKTQSSRTWALSAKESKVAAATSEANAKTSETNSKTSETNAKASETAAKTSETNAKTSETNANADYNATHALFTNTTKHTIVVTYEDNTTETINILGVNS